MVECLYRGMSRVVLIHLTPSMPWFRTRALRHLSTFAQSWVGRIAYTMLWMHSVVCIAMRRIGLGLPITSPTTTHAMVVNGGLIRFTSICGPAVSSQCPWYIVDRVDGMPATAIFSGEWASSEEVKAQCLAYLELDTTGYRVAIDEGIRNSCDPAILDCVDVERDPDGTGCSITLFLDTPAADFVGCNGGLPTDTEYRTALGRRFVEVFAPYISLSATKELNGKNEYPDTTDNTVHS